MSYCYRQARADDLVGVANLFTAAFPESIAHYFHRRPAAQVVAEPFALCLASEPEAFFVADGGSDGIAGYLFAPSCTGRLRRVALARGFVLRWLWGWVTGRYGLGLRPVQALAVNKLAFWSEAKAPEVRAEARILSIAVHPAHQGRGIAGQLLALGLERLDRLGARPVRLEVRPENLPAVKLYTRFGFRECGRTRDSQGDWTIMLRGSPG